MPHSADDIYGRASQLYIGVITKNGPHVTPDLFTSHDGKLWCMSAAGTLKSKILRRDARVGVLAMAGHDAVVATGTASILDPARPLEAATRPASTARAMIGATKFVANNAFELTGAVAAALQGKLGDPILPPHRVLIGIDPQAVAVLDGDAVVDDSGWDEEAASPAAPGEGPVDDDVDGVPDDLVRSDRTVVGWVTAAGAPLVMPAAWEAERCRATVPRALFELVGAAPSGAACATFDTWTGYGPLGKQGVMLRGTGTAEVVGERAELRLSIDRATYWDGIDTRTERL